MLIIVFILFIMFAPPIILTIIGSNKSDKKRAKTYYIAAVAYLIIGLGICGTIISSF